MGISGLRLRGRGHDAVDRVLRLDQAYVSISRNLAGQKREILESQADKQDRTR
jgi:hypothetical protein